MKEVEDSLERMLGEGALRPNDEMFIRRVLTALPPRARSRVAAGSGRSLVGAMKFGIALALFTLAQHWYLAGPGGLEAAVAILLFLVPTLAAVVRVCGAIIPRSAHRVLWRGGGHWR